MTLRFSALITQEDDFYVARCPELNVTSQGADIESARNNLREAIELYIDTWGTPESSKDTPEPFWTFVEVSR